MENLQGTLLGFILQIVVSGLYLYLAAQIVGATEARFGRAVLTGLVLGLVGPFAFAIPFLLLFFIPIVNLLAGLLVYFIVARVIVEGMMRVPEGTGVSIVIIWMLLSILINFLLHSFGIAMWPFTV